LLRAILGVGKNTRTRLGRDSSRRQGFTGSKCSPAVPGTKLIRRRAARRRPPRPAGRDSGGFPGYGEILGVLADPAHPDHAEVSASVAEVTGSDEPYDADFLDVDAVNRARAGCSKTV